MEPILDRSSTGEVSLVLRALAHAAGDALRAWAVSPQVFAECRYAVGDDGAVRLTSQRRFSLGNRLMVKSRVARRVFRDSLRARLARSLVVRRYGPEGLMSNLLHVMEVLQRVRSDARVHVDWSLDGTEAGFRYGRKGDDVWAGLFKPLDPVPSHDHLSVDHELDLTLWGTGKDYLSGAALGRHRRAYATAAARLIVVNGRVNEGVTAVAGCFEGRFVIGVHRRVGIAQVSNLQRDGMVPSMDQFIAACRACAPTGSQWCIFLATDDEGAVAPMRQAFGSRLIVREDVKRTDRFDLHMADWGTLSPADAEDVLIDTLLLARCDVLVHASSSVSTMAGLLNPTMQLIRVTGRA